MFENLLWINHGQFYHCIECESVSEKPLSIGHSSHCTTPVKIKIEQTDKLQEYREARTKLQREIKMLKQEKRLLLVQKGVLEDDPTYTEDFISSYAQLS